MLKKVIFFIQISLPTFCQKLTHEVAHFENIYFNVRFDSALKLKHKKKCVKKEEIWVVSLRFN